jgi:hypothetical protein
MTYAKHKATWVKVKDAMLVKTFSALNKLINGTPPVSPILEFLMSIFRRRL